jgi:hypothetical protein
MIFVQIAIIRMIYVLVLGKHHVDWQNQLENVIEIDWKPIISSKIHTKVDIQNIWVYIFDWQSTTRQR